MEKEQTKKECVYQTQINGAIKLLADILDGLTSEKACDGAKALSLLFCEIGIDLINKTIKNKIQKLEKEGK